MGLLESIGRSGAVGQFGQNMLNNALQYGQFSQQSQESQMRQKIMDQKLAEQERMNRPVLLSELVGKGTEKGRPNFMKVFADAAKLAGAKRIMLPDGSEDYTLAQADLPAVQKFLEMQKDMHPQLQWATYQDNLQMIPELQKQREKAKTPVEQMQIDEQIEAMKAENAGILTEFGKGEASKRSLVKVNEGGKPVYRSQEEAEGKEAYAEEKAPSPSWHVVVDKESPTGYSYKDLNSGKVGGVANPPRAEVEDKPITPAQKVQYTLQHRKEFEGLPVTKDYFSVMNQLGRLEKAIEENKTAKSKVAVDQALITIYNKMMDPSSVVRESEYARTPQDMALVNKVKGMWQKNWQGGPGLTDQEREAMARMARNFGSVIGEMYEKEANYYRELASAQGLNPDHVVKPDKHVYKPNTPASSGQPASPGAGNPSIKLEYGPDGKLRPAGG